MYTKIRTRGPDASGFWSDPFSGISLGHSRLSIIDLTEEGSQPMASPSGRYMVSYNGEIYNHNQLRRLLVEGKKISNWRGSSDTETILACLDVFGIKEAVTKFVGMFAIAV